MNVSLKNEDAPVEQATVHVDAPEPLTTEALHDLITRNRDYLGNRKGFCYAYNPATVDDTLIERSPLIGAIEVIREHCPGRAAQLEHYYNNKLLAAERRLYDVRLAEQLKLQQYNTRAIKENTDIDALVKSLEEDKAQAIAQHRQTFDSMNNSLSEAHKSAGEKMAGVGAPYDPANPTASSLFDISLNRMRAVAAELKLPWSPENTKPLLHTYLSWALSIVVGVMIGLSLGIMAQFLHPDTIAREMLPVLLFAIIGSAAAILGRAAIKYGHKQAAERSYLGLPWYHRIGVLLCALAVDVAVLCIDSTLEQQGLLATVRFQNAINSLSGAAGSSSSQAIYFLCAVVLSLGYTTCAAWEGYMAGRQEAITNLVHARCEEIIEEKKGDAAVAEALSAIAQVNALRYQITELESRISRPYDQKVAQLQSRRLPVLDDLPLNSKERVQDAIDNFNGAQNEFDAAMEAVLRGCENPPRASIISLLKRKAARRKEAHDRIRQR